METQAQSLIRGTDLGQGIGLLGEKIIKNTRDYSEYLQDTLKITGNARKAIYLLGFDLQDLLKDNFFQQALSEKIAFGDCRISIGSYRNDIMPIKEKFEKTFKDSELLKKINLYSSDAKHEPSFIATDDSILIKGRCNENGLSDIYLRSEIYTEHSGIFSLFLSTGGRNLSMKYKQYFINLADTNKLQKINNGI